MKSEASLNHGAPDETFVLAPRLSHDVTAQFRTSDAHHDIVSLPDLNFGGSLATVLQNARDTAGGAITFDPRGKRCHQAGLGMASGPYIPVEARRRELDA